MLTEKKPALRTYPSLLPLQLALTAAVSAAATQPAGMDANEQCAVLLIENLKAGYKKQQFVLNWSDVPSPSGLQANLPATVNGNAR